MFNQFIFMMFLFSVGAGLLIGAIGRQMRK
jgi:hypothetical protein